MTRVGAQVVWLFQNQGSDLRRLQLVHLLDRER